jgi:adenine-specific DNA-methyltransferase
LDKKKELGQVFTPEWVVDLILDEAGYSGVNVLTQLLLEPSCGDGIFLIAAAKRLISEARKAELADDEISSLLQANLWGVEYDEEVFNEAVNNLDSLLVHEALPSVEWNMFCQDALTFENYGMFDVVVGNPPYIRVHNMDEAMRKNVKQFAMSTGTTDLYIIFFELGMRWLNQSGRLGYIAPNSWLKNSSQRSFRADMIQKKQLAKIINYGSRPIFGKEAATYTAVVILDKAGELDAVQFIEEGTEQRWENVTSYDSLAGYAGEPLSFSSVTDSSFISSRSQFSVLLSDLGLVQNGVATLRDKIFLNPPESEHDDDICLPVVKASTYKGQSLEKRIVFPYRYVDGKIVGLTEVELSVYPATYAYLNENKDELLERDTDKSAEWFHYGRSQGLVNMGKPKLVFSHVIGLDQTKITSYILPAECVVYSGLFVTAQDGHTLEEIQAVIESEEFCRYMKLTGKDMSGGYKTVGAKNVKNFPVR